MGLQAASAVLALPEEPEDRCEAAYYLGCGLKPTDTVMRLPDVRKSGGRRAALGRLGPSFGPRRSSGELSCEAAATYLLQSPKGSWIPQSARMSIHTVFSVDGSLYHRWQADLLAYSHQKAGQSGPLTRLWSAHGRPVPFAGRTLKAEPYSPHPRSGDDYPPYNKPSALQAWLRDATPAEDLALILDPDCVFLEPQAWSAERGSPLAQAVNYLIPTDNPELVRRHCRKPGAVQGIGIPLLIHREDLRLLVPRWLHKTEAIRDDPKSRELAGWLAEMWGYAFAAADLGLRHIACELACFQKQNRADLPIIHYCCTSSDADGRWTWDKRTYRPWRRVADPPASTPLASVTLIRLLNEYAATQQFRQLRQRRPEWKPRRRDLPGIAAVKPEWRRRGPGA
jgi:hypothetical protein